MQHREIQEGDVADPHDQIHIDIFEPFFHEPTGITHVLLQTGEICAAGLVVLAEQHHANVGTDETAHHDEDGEGGGQEGVGVGRGGQQTARCGGVGGGVAGVAVGTYAEGVQEGHHFGVAVGRTRHQVHELAGLHHSVGVGQCPESYGACAGGHVGRSHNLRDIAGET